MRGSGADSKLFVSASWTTLLKNGKDFVIRFPRYSGFKPEWKTSNRYNNNGDDKNIYRQREKGRMKFYD